MIRVSVIIPTFNSEKRLHACLGALARQQFEKKDYEVIVVDDGSTDDTAQIARQFDVHYFFQENSGPAAARNLGAQKARGKILLFTDDDCIPETNWIHQMTAPFSDPDITGVKGAYKTAQKELWARFAQVEFSERYERLSKQTYTDMVDTYSAGYRKEIFLSLGGFDPSFPVPNNEDTDLSYKMSQNGYRMVFNPRAIVFHTGHPDSLIKYAKVKFWRGYWRMAVYQRYAQKMISDTYTPQTLKLQILLVFFMVLCLKSLFLFNFFIALFLLLLCFVLFWIACIPFIRHALQQDAAIAFFSPLFLFVRAAVLGFGTLYRLWNVGLKKSHQLLNKIYS